MPNQSVKIDDATQHRLRALAQRQGITPHALMVRAIGSELDRLDAETSFVAQAEQALSRAMADGPVYDGPAYAAYLREKVAAARQTSAKPPRRPAATTLAAMAQTAKPRA